MTVNFSISYFSLERGLYLFASGLVKLRLRSDASGLVSVKMNCQS